MPERAQDQTSSLSDVAKRIRTLERATRIRKKKPKESLYTENSAPGVVVWLSEPVELFTYAGTGAAAYTSYISLDLSTYVGSKANTVILEYEFSNNRSGGSAADTDFRLEWLTDINTTPYKVKYYDEHELVDDANSNIIGQSVWPINQDKTAQYRVYDDDTFQDYTVTLKAYVNGQ